MMKHQGRKNGKRGRSEKSADNPVPDRSCWVYLLEDFMGIGECKATANRKYPGLDIGICLMSAKTNSRKGFDAEQSA